MFSDELLAPQRHKAEGEIFLKSANSSTILRYFDPELGIDGDMSTSAKFVSDDDSFWYKVHFHDIQCIDQVMSLDAGIYTHSWNCTESGCGSPCEGAMCKYADVTVLNEENSSRDAILPDNCGDAVKVSISKPNAKALGYHFFEIAELAVIGRDCYHLSMNDFNTV